MSSFFIELKSQPTPFGGRSAASSGPRWAERLSLNARCTRTSPITPSGRRRGVWHIGIPGDWSPECPTIAGAFRVNSGSCERFARGTCRGEGDWGEDGSEDI